MPEIPPSFPNRGGKRLPFYKYRLLSDSSGLLAITKQTEEDGWRVTHVPTKFAFPFTFDSYQEAVNAGRQLYRNFPLNQLQAKTPQEVVGKISTKQVAKMIGRDYA